MRLGDGLLGRQIDLSRAVHCFPGSMLRRVNTEVARKVGEGWAQCERPICNPIVSSDGLDIVET